MIKRTEINTLNEKLKFMQNSSQRRVILCNNSRMHFMPIADVIEFEKLPLEILFTENCYEAVEMMKDKPSLLITDLLIGGMEMKDNDYLTGVRYIIEESKKYPQCRTVAYSAMSLWPGATEILFDKAINFSEDKAYEEVIEEVKKFATAA